MKQLANTLPAGHPVDSVWLAAHGVSPQLAYRYVKSGWLNRVAVGVFVRPGAPLDLDRSLALLASRGLPLHVGGRSALAWHGARHYLRFGGERLTLYRRGRFTMPAWLAAHFPCRVVGAKLFKEDPAQPLAITDTLGEHPGVPIAQPERAVLELLHGVPSEQSMEEATALMEGMQGLRASLLQPLLAHCTRVKTVRLFLHFARRFDLPCMEQLDVSALPTGSKSRYVRRTPEGVLVLKA